MTVFTAPRLSIADLGSHAPTSAPAPAPEVPSKPASTSTPNFRRGSQAASSAERPQGSTRPASQKQTEFITKLLGERVLTDTIFAGHTFAPAGLTSRAASTAITTLLTLPKVEVPAEPVAPKVPTPRVNQYGGRCEECGTRVEAKEGTVTKADNGKWEVTHLAGECPVSEFPFPSGRYAVEVDGSLHFFVATTEDGLFEQASDTLYPVQGQRVATVVALIAEDPEAASRTYGRELKVCGRCNRALTDEVSRAAGIGPVCASKGWA